VLSSRIPDAILLPWWQEEAEEELTVGIQAMLDGCRWAKPNHDHKVGLPSSEFHLVVEGARSTVSWLLRYPSWDSAGCICWLETSVGKHEHVQPLVNAESD
jgi:hypothetical protein